MKLDRKLFLRIKCFFCFGFFCSYILLDQNWAIKHIYNFNCNYIHINYKAWSWRALKKQAKCIGISIHWSPDPSPETGTKFRYPFLS